MDELSRKSGMIVLNKLHPVQLSRFYKFDGESYSVLPNIVRRLEKHWLLNEAKEEGK